MSFDANTGKTEEIEFEKLDDVVDFVIDDDHLTVCILAPTTNQHIFRRLPLGFV